MPGPSASVVVSTYNRAAMLDRLLGALAAQEGAGAFEVVVVDDASTDDTPAMIERWAATAPFPLAALRQPRNAGQAAGRNRGWRAATSDSICFTDDDCVPAPTWLRGLLAALDEADIAQGRTRPIPEQVERWGPFSHTILNEAEEGFYETCNIGYRRAVLERLGGFDESWRYGEDADLAWRARKAAATTTYAPDALVHHEVFPSELRRDLRQAVRRAGIVRLVHDHPELRRSLPSPWFHQRSHPYAVGVVAAGALIARRPASVPPWLLGAAAGAAYFRACKRSRRNPARRRDWPIVLPQALAVDLVAVAALARASARYRTLLL